jgi:hypothetical protein
MPVDLAAQNKSDKIADSLKKNPIEEAEQEDEDKSNKKTKMDSKAKKDEGKSSS